MSAVVHGVWRSLHLSLPLHSRFFQVSLGLVTRLFRVQLLRACIEHAESARATEVSPLIPNGLARGCEAEAPHDFVGLHVVSEKVAWAELRTVAALIARRFPDAMLRLNLETAALNESMIGRQNNEACTSLGDRET